METELEQRYAELRDDLEELQRATNIEAAQLRQQLQTLRAALGGYADSDLASLAATLRAAADASAKYYEAMQDAQEEAADLRRQLAEARGEISNLRRERKELLSELDGLSAELAARR